MAIIELTKTNFDRTVTENNIVIVDFWASWCNPCLAFAEVFEQVAQANPEIVFAKVNVEEEETLASDFEIRSIPHLVVMKQGIAIFSESGSMPVSALQELVDQAKAADVSDIKAKIEGENQ